jgi:O-antigen ligase
MSEEDINKKGLELADSFHPVFKVNGFRAFICFIALFATSQFFYTRFSILTFFFIALAGCLLVYLMLRGNTNDLFLFLFFTLLMRITIPVSNREVSLFLPAMIGSIIIIKNLNQLQKIKLYYFQLASILLFGYFFLMMYQVFNGLELPGFISGDRSNSGFLSRWNLFNMVIVFFSILISFKMETLGFLINKLCNFYVVVLIISILMLLLGIKKMPLFNSFSWSVIRENESSQKMIIAGFASIMLLIYSISFKKRNSNYVLILLLLFGSVIVCGSRSSFLAFFLIFFFGWAIYKKFLGRSIFVLCIASISIGFILLSPLILLVPEKYQRLVIIFPSEFYIGPLKKIAVSAAASSSDFRYEMWTKAKKEIGDHIIFGKGLGIPNAPYDLSLNGGMKTFQKIPQSTLINDFMTTGNLHNTFISIAYIMGLPALFFFICFVIFLLVKTYRISLNATGVYKNIFTFFSLIILHFLILACISDIHFQVEFYVLIAVIMKASFIYANSLKRKNDLGIQHG